tara:strand:+ start:137 stop:760 length:624 start_codon:yes stop_codon:yes gene_type:complete
LKKSNNNLLLIFTRNPELGKCKTRLATKVGDQNALDIYKFLLAHTVDITKDLNATKQVHYSASIWENDIWETSIFDKKLQLGKDLGIRMQNAFKQGFEDGYDNIIVIGSDMYDMNTIDLENAFQQLSEHDFVIGPAEDGGYYLLGMRIFNTAVFKNKEWGTETVLNDTLNDLKNNTLKLLPPKNDIDYYEDIKDIEVFQPYLKNTQE